MHHVVCRMSKRVLKKATRSHRTKDTNLHIDRGLERPVSVNYKGISQNLNSVEQFSDAVSSMLYLRASSGVMGGGDGP